MRTKKHQPNSVWISSEETAELIGILPGTLSNWRISQKEDQPPFYRHGKFVQYKRAEVVAWIEAHRVEFSSP